MTRGWTLAVAVLAGVIVIGVACGGGDAPSPAPTSSPASTATSTPSPTPSPTPTATPSPSPAPATATPSPSPSPMPTATSTTLAVFSTLVSRAYREEGWEPTRRVYVLDIGVGTYWRAFDYLYPGATRLVAANASIVFADGERVRRFAPDGRDEATLYEGEAVRELSVSPDGAKVAFTDTDGILVLDVATGERLLRAERDAELAALLPDASTTPFSINRWNAASDAIAVTASGGDTGESRAGILTLDGDLQVLLPNSGNLSPDFRHAIRLHLDTVNDWIDVTAGFDVIELESGRAVHTVTAEADTFIVPRPGWQLGPDRFAWFEMSRRLGSDLCPYDLTMRPREAGSVTAAVSCAHPISVAHGNIDWWEEGFTGEDAVVGPRILDLAAGAIREPAQDEWRRMRADATRLSTRRRCAFSRHAATCNLFYEGRPIWTGVALEAVGLIEPDEPFAPRGVEVRAAPHPSAPQAPPPRAEMAGPLLVWSEAGGYEAEAGENGAERFHGLRRVMVHDAGTGRSWRAFDYRYPPPYYVTDLNPGFADSRPASQVQAARAGFTVWVEDGWNAGTVRYVSLEGRETVLVEHRAIRGVLLAPSGERAVVRTGLDDTDGAFLIFDLPSGRLSQRVALSDLRAWLFPPDEWRGEGELLTVRIDPARWNTGGTAFSIGATHTEWDGGIGLSAYRAGVLSLDGAFRPLPLYLNEQALSPDFRYIARGRNDAGEYQSYHWASLDIVDMATERVVRSVPVGERIGRALGNDDWGWTADGRFAWAPGYRSLASAGPDDEAEAQPVEVLDVRTGVIERVAPGGHFADERATVSCPDDAPVGLCAILLDGEVVGRGQWAEVIGVVALD